MPRQEMIGLFKWPQIAAVLIGSLAVAVGIDFFLVPFMVLDGGMIGVALIINYLSGAKVGLVMALSSIPVFALAWFYDRSIFYSSLFGLTVSSFLIDFLEPYHYHFVYAVKLSPFASSFLGGILIGTGLGIMLRFNSSTGGLDLLAQLVSTFVIRNVNVGVAIFFIDGLIISLGWLLLSAETFLLSIVTVTAGGMATSLSTWKIHFIRSGVPK